MSNVINIVNAINQNRKELTPLCKEIVEKIKMHIKNWEDGLITDEEVIMHMVDTLSK